LGLSSILFLGCSISENGARGGVENGRIDTHGDDGIARSSTSGTVRNTAQVDELILESKAVNITDISTALELYTPLPMKN